MSQKPAPGGEAQMDLRGSLRLFRAALVTGMTMSLAAAGHVLGGGALPDRRPPPSRCV
ncbi:hypothetical protein [Arthrobacter sp. KBS0703]|uniref:hypothetical protein n=1 Tax=Arthrobacter sp. KBS0703 TaxID=1955698 RepID=UPI00163DC10F|nr:hypothetical protein [Arthrobacter sp. KBS0703]